MKKYKVFLSDNKDSVDKYMENINKPMAIKCEDIEKLINSDYEIRDQSTTYGELHSIVEVTNYNTDEKNLVTIFEKEINDVEFIQEEKKEPFVYELSNQQLKYINSFKKVVVMDKKFIVEDIYYDVTKEVVKIKIKKE